MTGGVRGEVAALCLFAALAAGCTTDPDVAAIAGRMRAAPDAAVAVGIDTRDAGAPLVELKSTRAKYAAAGFFGGALAPVLGCSSGGCGDPRLLLYEMAIYAVVGAVVLGVTAPPDRTALPEDVLPGAEAWQARWTADQRFLRGLRTRLVDLGNGTGPRRWTAVDVPPAERLHLVVRLDGLSLARRRGETDYRLQVRLALLLADDAFRLPLTWRRLEFESAARPAAEWLAGDGDAYDAALLELTTEIARDIRDAVSPRPSPPGDVPSEPGRRAGMAAL